MGQNVVPINSPAGDIRLFHLGDWSLVSVMRWACVLPGIMISSSSSICKDLASTLEALVRERTKSRSMCRYCQSESLARSSSQSLYVELMNATSARFLNLANNG